MHQKKSQLDWYKSKGYLHITPQIGFGTERKKIIRKITDPDFISRYAFYPLIHTNIYERRYKRIANGSKDRAHSYISETGESVKSTKVRPLHYATHFDSLVYGYYASIIQNEYEQKLARNAELSKCIIAYRRIEIEGEEKNKSTIHFAKEVFSEIKERAEQSGSCAVLAFDIKGFFPGLDHSLLKKSWADIIDKTELPIDHYKVYRAVTNFSYILLDDLRVKTTKKGRHYGFNEKELADIRNTHGIQSFFESPSAFRDRIKTGKLRIHKYPFRNAEGKPIGIPQGLAISATLANIYLKNFDERVFEYIVEKKKGFYRRYSDDIAIVCSVEDVDEIQQFISEEIQKQKLNISTDKTEQFEYKFVSLGKKSPELISIKKTINGKVVGAPFVYLGFSFDGRKMLIKSANISKFYRKLIHSVKRKAKRAIKIAQNDPENKEAAIFRRQLYKEYNTKKTPTRKISNNKKRLEKNEVGEYRLISIPFKRKLRSNYTSYVNRAAEIMNEPAIQKQIRKHRAIFNEAIRRHFSLKK